MYRRQEEASADALVQIVSCLSSKVVQIDAFLQEIGSRCRRAVLGQRAIANVGFLGYYDINERYVTARVVVIVVGRVWSRGHSQVDRL
jgi:hypothetical protein